MNRGGRIITDIARLTDVFATQCADRETLALLRQTVVDRARWRKGHDLFHRIRSQHLVAERNNNRQLVAQYLFEEACAKTIYNLSGASAPFDADSPYWVIPSALVLASALGIDHSEVLGVVAAESEE